jgi:hypothetical protein
MPWTMLRDLGFDMYAWPFTDGKTARSSSEKDHMSPADGKPNYKLIILLGFTVRE